MSRIFITVKQTVLHETQNFILLFSIHSIIRCCKHQQTMEFSVTGISIYFVYRIFTLSFNLLEGLKIKVHPSEKSNTVFSSVYSLKKHPQNKRRLKLLDASGITTISAHRSLRNLSSLSRRFCISAFVVLVSVFGSRAIHICCQISHDNSQFSNCSDSRYLHTEDICRFQQPLLCEAFEISEFLVFQMLMEQS